jgi:hydroxyacylglutathione hydrolase
MHAAVVDPGDAEPILAALQAHGLTLTAILLTHHHADHIGGVTRLLEHSNVPVFGPRNDGIAARQPPVGRRRSRTSAGPRAGTCRAGRARPHAGPHRLRPRRRRAGTGCSAATRCSAAAAAACSKGTPKQMAASLAKLAALPDDTLVYCAHEYTLSNLRFAEARRAGQPRAADAHRQRQPARGTHLPTIPSTSPSKRRQIRSCARPSRRSSAAWLRRQERVLPDAWRLAPIR